MYKQNKDLQGSNKEQQIHSANVNKTKVKQIALIGRPQLLQESCKETHRTVKAYKIHNMPQTPLSMTKRPNWRDKTVQTVRRTLENFLEIKAVELLTRTFHMLKSHSPRWMTAKCSTTHLLLVGIKNYEGVSSTRLDLVHSNTCPLLLNALKLWTVDAKETHLVILFLLFLQQCRFLDFVTRFHTYSMVFAINFGTKQYEPVSAKAQLDNRKCRVVQRIPDIPGQW